MPTGTTVNRIDTTVIARDLAAVDRGSVDCVIAFVHWGNEYERRPDSEQRMLAGFLRRHGADLVVGSHPHVVQPFEQDSTGAVFYSLGNFVSNQRRRYCDGGLLAEVEVVQARCGGRADDATMPHQAVPVWVALPDYRILPPEVADTLAMPPHARAAYDRFMQDTRRLLDERE